MGNAFRKGLAGGLMGLMGGAHQQWQTTQNNIAEEERAVKTERLKRALLLEEARLAAIKSENDFKQKEALEGIKAGHTAEREIYLETGRNERAKLSRQAADVRSARSDAASGENSSKPPSGYRWKKDDPTALEAIPGGPADKASPLGDEGGNDLSAPGKLTEQQSKDVVYFTRGSEANALLDKMEKERTYFGGKQGLRGLADSAVQGIPFVGDTGVANAMVSKERQMADQAGRSFLSAILRKDSGAAITKEEVAIYTKDFLPMPGDSDEVIAQKREARKTALKAMEAGLGPARAAVPQLKSEAADAEILEQAKQRVASGRSREEVIAFLRAKGHNRVADKLAALQ